MGRKLWATFKKNPGICQKRPPYKGGPKIFIYPKGISHWGNMVVSNHKYKLFRGLPGFLKKISVGGSMGGGKKKGAAPPKKRSFFCAAPKKKKKALLLFYRARPPARKKSGLMLRGRVY